VEHDNNSQKWTKTYNTEDSPVVTDLSTSSALRSLCFRRRGVKKLGVSGPENRCLFPSVSAVRFKKTAKPTVPQHRSGLCYHSGQSSTAIGHSPAPRQQGNDGLRTPCDPLRVNAAVGRHRLCRSSKATHTLAVERSSVFDRGFDYRGGCGHGLTVGHGFAHEPPLWLWKWGTEEGVDRSVRAIDKPIDGIVGATDQLRSRCLMQM
jgi:hypothetical protein